MDNSGNPLPMPPVEPQQVQSGDAQQQQQAPAGDDKKRKSKTPKVATKIKQISAKAKSVDWKNLDVKTLFEKKNDELVTGTATMFEISLVPSIKAQMIKTLKTRNLVIFICIVVVSAAAGIVMLLGSIVTGQNVTMGNQEQKIETMSEKINSFDGLSEYLTIKDQLGNIATISENRKMLSRVFSFLKVLLPDEPDKITISELGINLEDNTMDFTGQADARVEPFIDYRVLEAFKKSAALVKYDYGRYIDSEDVEIPTRCMLETGTDGNILKETKEINTNTNTSESDGGNQESKRTVNMTSIYAYWMRGKDGCDTARTERDLELADFSDEAAQNDMSEEEILAGKKEIYDKYEEQVPQNWYDKWLKENELTRYTDSSLSARDTISRKAAYDEWYESLTAADKHAVDTEISEGVDYRNVDIVKVYRTPQYSDWYRKGYLDLSGGINGVPHFDSQCISYTGTEVDGQIRWSSTNECMMMDGDINIENSSNGRDASKNLVLRFEASATFNDEPLLFKNKHVLAIGPNGQDVTDSYQQVEGIFGERAEDCKSSDVVCIQDTENEEGEGSENE